MRVPSLAVLVVPLLAAILGCGQDPSLPQSFSSSSSALNGVQTIRIGVVPSGTSVSVGGTGAFEVRDSASGTLLLSGNAQTASVTYTVQVSTTSRRLQVMCTGSTTTRDTRLAAGAAAGYSVYTEYVSTAKCWRVFVGERPLPINTTLEAQLRAEIISKKLADNTSVWVTKTVTQGQTGYKVALGGSEAMSSGPVRVSALSGYVTIAGRQYRGEAEVRLNNSGALAGINELALEDYLYGVVPRELGPIAYPELEALKAQAVAARTYALANLGKRGADGYDLLATTSDQVYGGVQDEHPLSTQAVNETAGVAATYEGKLIDALYFSTSGGFTADNEEVYNSAPVAYLRGVPDRELGNALDHVPSIDVFRNRANAQSLRNAREGDFESDWSRFHRWTYEWSADEMSQVVSAFAKQDVGRVLAINVTDRGPSGRALRIEYVTEAGTFVDTKDKIRASLKFVNASGALQNLPSTMFFIEPVLARRTGEITGFVVYGGGFGHGVGMSQTGAVGMAQKNATYDEILHHYYQGIELVQL